MKLFINQAFLYCLVILFVSSCLRSQEAIVDPATPSSETIPGLTEEQLDIIYTQISDFPDQSQFSLALIQNDTVLYFGFQRLAASLTLVNNKDSIFEIGSISKVFTATLLSAAVLEIKASLSDTIDELLDEPGNETGITLVQLANHTSGLPKIPDGMLFTFILNQDNPYKDYDREKLMDYLTDDDLKLLSTPGEKYEYSNLGAGLLAVIIDDIYETDYETLLKSKIFDPYQMTNSTSQRKSLNENFVKGRNSAGEITPNWDLASMEGAGAILSSTNDLVKFAQAQFIETDEMLALTRAPTFVVDDNLKMGLGWHIRNDSIFWHNGGTGGYRSYMAVNPSSGTGVVVLSNVSAMHSKAGNIDNLGYQLLNTMND